MEGAEGIGEAVTGGLAARAMEPSAGEAPHGRRSACLNCGAQLTGAYCNSCGQPSHVHRTLGAFWHDITHSVLHFEGKIWRTLPLLAWRPGELTRRYVEGERARFVSPIAMFLFSVFLMFAVFSSIGSYAYRDRNAQTGASGANEAARLPADSVEELKQEFEAERRETLGEIEALVGARAQLLAAGKDTRPVDVDIASLRRELQMEKQLFAQALQLQRLEDARTEAHKKPVEGIYIHPQGGVSLGWLDENYRRAKRNPSLLAYKLQSNAYKFSWALIPIMTPFIWLLFLHRRDHRQYKLYDHAVFVTYSLAFLSLATIAFTFLKLLGLSGPAALLPLLIPPIHMYRQLRGAYLLSAWGALWRTVLLLFFSIVAGSLFFILLVMLGVGG